MPYIENPTKILCINHWIKLQKRLQTIGQIKIFERMAQHQGELLIPGPFEVPVWIPKIWKLALCAPYGNDNY